MIVFILPMLNLPMIVWKQLCNFIYTYWWKPQTVRKFMERQGIRGPTPSFITGNLADMTILRDLPRLLMKTWTLDHNSPPSIMLTPVDIHSFTEIRKHRYLFTTRVGRSSSVSIADTSGVGNAINHCRL